MITLLKHWQYKLGIEDWKIDTEPIDSEQVMYPDDIGNDNYFIGVVTNVKLKEATIYHDVPLYEEVIVHELLHVRYPEEDEDWINYVSKNLLK